MSTIPDKVLTKSQSLVVGRPVPVCNAPEERKSSTPLPALEWFQEAKKTISRISGLLPVARTRRMRKAAIKSCHCCSATSCISRELLNMKQLVNDPDVVCSEHVSPTNNKLFTEQVNKVSIKRICKGKENFMICLLLATRITVASGNNYLNFRKSENENNAQLMKSTLHKVHVIFSFC